MKVFVLDSSVILYTPYALGMFDDNMVVIPRSVLQTVAKAAQTGVGEIRANAVEFGRILDSVLDGPGESTMLENGGCVKIAGTDEDSVCAVAETMEGILVSRDPMARVMARSRGLRAEEFKAEATTGSQSYTGRCTLYVSNGEMRRFVDSGRLALDQQKDYCATDAEGEVLSECYKLTINEYVTLVDSSNPSGATLLGRFDGENIVPLFYYGENKPVFGVRARNVGQKFAIDALMNPNAPLVILSGPAGTAKTFLSMAAGLEQTMETNSIYRRILVTRPNTKMDNDVGFLRGDEKEKVMPTLRGLLDNVDNLMPDAENPVDELMARSIIEAQAMAYMRGRSITRQYMIVDEMQNSNATQALSIITRIGDGSKIVLLGDPAQIDSPYLDSRNNGLAFAAARMKGSPYCWQLTFMDCESTRSPLAREAIERMSPKRRAFMAPEA